MLRVTPLRRDAAAYYLADLAAELAVPERAAAPAAGHPGTWCGRGADGLGLRGPVDAASLEALLAGRHPATGRPLVGRARSVGGYDLTFTAPKSVSLLWGLGTPDAARAAAAAHARAVTAATGYVARRAAAVRTGTGTGAGSGAGEERAVAPVAGLVAASFTHGVSRALDPHLHTHVVVANLGHGPDGRWRSLDGRGLFAHAAAAGALYGAALRIELGRELGVGWQFRPSGGYELAGTTALLVGAFSQRRAEIGAHGFGRAPGDTTRRSRGAWAATRDPKAPVLTPVALAAGWEARARAWDLEPAGRAIEPPIPGVGTRWRGAGGPGVLDEHRFAATLDASSRHGAARRHVVSAWAGAALDGLEVDRVEGAVELLVPWAGGVGVAEDACAPGRVVPAPHHLAALGPRPADPGGLAVWLTGARALDHYRQRWGVDSRLPGSGPGDRDQDLAGLPARRLADLLACRRRLEEACRRLGRPTERDREALALGRDQR